jgi:hypothetical protein
MTMARIVLRGTLATLAHRARRGLLNAPASVANYCCGESSLTAVETIAHMGDLMAAWPKGSRSGTIPLPSPGIRNASVSLLR